MTDPVETPPPVDKTTEVIPERVINRYTVPGSDGNPLTAVHEGGRTSITGAGWYVSAIPDAELVAVCDLLTAVVDDTLDPEEV